jgi:hypothetical protein
MSVRRSLRRVVCIGLTFASACATAGTRTSSPSPAADTLYHAALLHASPDKSTYDPDRAAELLTAFIERFPSDRRRGDAAARLALVNEVRALRAELRALKAIDLARPPR